MASYISPEELAKKYPNSLFARPAIIFGQKPNSSSPEPASPNRKARRSNARFSRDYRAGVVGR